MQRDLTLDAGRALLAGTGVAILLAGLIVLLHYELHDAEPLTALWEFFGGWLAMLVIVLGLAIHEALHAATWMAAGRLRRDELRVGLDWRGLMPYAHPCRPITVRAYAMGTAAPGLLLGVLPAAVGLAIGNGPLAGWGAIFTAVAASDVLVLFVLRGVPGDEVVQDHPTRLGCRLVDPD